MKAVSYSGLQTYYKCPSAFNRRYILQEEVPEQEKSGAVNRGLAMHKAIEEFLDGNNAELPQELAFYQEWLTDLRGNETLQPEFRFCFDKQWEPTNFNSPEGKIRGVVDAILQDGDVGYVYEWKTGKKYPDHEMQRGLYGLAGLLALPSTKEVTVFTVYLDQQEMEISTFDREMITAYQWMWDSRVDSVWAEQDYEEIPSWKCRWCSYSKENGGTCPN